MAAESTGREAPGCDETCCYCNPIPDDDVPADRLDVIEQRFYGGEGGPTEDVAWLIAEVRLLRFERSELEQLRARVAALQATVAASWDVVGEGYSEELPSAIECLVEDRVARERLRIVAYLRVQAHRLPDALASADMLAESKAIERGEHNGGL